MSNLTPDNNSRGVYEIKFLVDQRIGIDIRDWAGEHLEADPHSTGLDGYCVHSLYLDTPAFDVFHQADGFRQRKYRLRRYGAESMIWLELKRKQQGRVRKHRTSIAESVWQTRLLCPGDDEWDGRWFQRRLDRLQLRPVCQVTYQRYACVGTSAFGPLRLTLDSHLQSVRADDWGVPSQPLTGPSLMPGQQILELKFHETIPNLYRDLIHDFKLQRTTFSKYRHSAESCVSIDQLVGEDRAA